MLQLYITVSSLGLLYISAAGLDYNETTSSLVFTDQSTESVPVGIVDDNLFEPQETFFGRLNVAGVLPPNVYLEPIEAKATIYNERMI